jgi:hypothetical protein
VRRRLQRRQCAIRPSAVDVCDGVDNDCNGIVDNGITVPGTVNGLVSGPLKNELHWSPVVGADRYDVVRGDLLSLRGSSGDFTSSLSACIDDAPGSTTSDAATPGIGGGLYYLVRAQAACKNGSFSQWTGAEQPGRDIEISLSPLTCP